MDALRDKLKDKYGEPGFSAETGSYFWPANVGEPMDGTNIATIVLSYFALGEVSLTYTFNNASPPAITTLRFRPAQATGSSWGAQDPL